MPKIPYRHKDDSEDAEDSVLARKEDSEDAEDSLSPKKIVDDLVGPKYIVDVMSPSISTLVRREQEDCPLLCY
jgi:hypothetical protein